jgi:adenosylcobyric acid synthase
MLGRSVSDPRSVEGGGEIRGLGLLAADTVFESEKTRTRVRGRVLEAEGIFGALKGAEFTGYELHMGSAGPVEKPFSLLFGDGGERPDGLASGNVWGSYVHGIFEKADFAGRFVDCLLKAKGLEEGGGAVDWDEYKERQYDILADGVRKALDMDFVYKVLEGGGIRWSFALRGPEDKSAGDGVFGGAAFHTREYEP